jgi:hypothetical protein
MVTLAGCTDSPTGITAENARIGIVGGNLQVARVTEEARAVEGEELHAGDPPASLSLCRATHRTWKNAHVATMPCRSTHPSVSGATQAER